MSTTVVRKVVHRPPRHRTIVRRFVPWAQPSPAQVHVIVRAEAARWHAPKGILEYRISHESGWLWWKCNGKTYCGLLQFSPSTFSRGVSTMPRDVRLVSRYTRTRRSEVVRVYSDGHVTRGRGKRRRVAVTLIRKGKLPRSPGWTHGWAQVRIGAQALAGRSAVHASEWPARY